MLFERLQLIGLEFPESERAQRLQPRHVVLGNASDRGSSAGLRIGRRRGRKIRFASGNSPAGELGIVVAVGAVRELFENRASATSVPRLLKSTRAPVLTHVAIDRIVRSHAGALEFRSRSSIVVREIERPRNAKPRILGGVAAGITRGQPSILRARGIKLMLFFKDFADAENSAGRALAGREIRDEPVQRRACEIVLIVMPVNQRERFQSRRRVRSAGRDLQILEDRALGAVGLRLERPRRHPNQLSANRRLGTHRESRVRLLLRLGQSALAQQQFGFRAMVRERVRVGDLGMRREDLTNENARFSIGVGMRILVAQFHQLRIRRLWISERDKRLRFRDARALLYRRFRTARDQPRRDLGRLRVASEVQQVVRQHQLARIDHHAIRIRLDEAIERLC